MDVSDEELLEQYVAGRTESLSELVERYRRPLYRFILRMVPAPADADEVFQDVWVRVIRKAADYRRNRFRGWVFRITHNLLIDRARGNRHLLSLDETVTGDSEVSRRDQVVASGLPPDAAVAGRDLGARIRAAVARLPPEQREVFLLRVDADVDFKDIARMQKVSINTALARMQYALTKMKVLLNDEYAMWRETR